MIDREDVKTFATIVAAVLAAGVLVIAAAASVGAALGFAVRIFLAASGLGS